MAADTYDYIIVGAGTAGCLLANRLSADRGRARAAARGRRQGQLPLDPHPRRLPLPDGQPARRLVLQDRRRAGPQRPQPQLSARQGARRLLVHQRHDLHARPGARLRSVAPDGQPRLGLGRRAALLQEAPGPVGAGARRLRRACTPAAANGASSSRASAGTSSTPSARPPPRPASPRSTTSTAATTRAAATSTSTRRPACAGTRRRAFLRPVRAPPQPDGRDARAWCERLIARGQARHRPRAAPERASRARSRRTREVILAAGAIGSPQILQLSGIGPGALLQKLGIAVQHDLTGVGENLQDHLQIRCAYKVTGVQDHERALPEPGAARGLRARVRAARGAGR